MASTAAGNGDTGAVTVFVTVPSDKIGEEIAGVLVNPETRLAACVSIIPGNLQINIALPTRGHDCAICCRGIPNSASRIMCSELFIYRSSSVLRMLAKPFVTC